MTILIKGARVLTFDESDRELLSADVLIEESTITAVGPDLPTPSDLDLRVIDGAGSEEQGGDEEGKRAVHAREVAAARKLIHDRF